MSERQRANQLLSGRPHVIFVDDEPHVLAALRRALRDRRGDWDMTFAVGAAEALAVAADRPCDVLVTDFRMSDMDGGALLQAMYERHPRTGRVILSGHTDEGDLLKVLLLAHVFLHKPCEQAEIVNAIDRIIAVRSALRHAEIERLLLASGTMPDGTGQAARLLSMLDRSDRSLSAVAGFVEEDPGCAAAVVEAARAVTAAIDGVVPPSGLPSPTSPTGTVTGVADAAAVLGIRSVRSLLLLRDLVQAAGRAGTPAASWAASLYTDALATATLARCLAGSAPWADTAFKAGLLAEIGLLAVPSCGSAEVPVSHAEVGAYLLDHWGLSVAVVEAVLHHERSPEPSVPPDQPDPSVASTVALARAAIAGQRGAACPLVPAMVGGTR